MTKIRATCYTCGDVEFGVDKITLITPSYEERENSFIFDCPSCSQQIGRVAYEAVIDSLKQGGVSTKTQRDVNLSKASPITDKEIDCFAQVINETPIYAAVICADMSLNVLGIPDKE